MRGTHWQPWEKLFLHDVCQTMHISVIAEKLERSQAAITRQASRIDAPLPSRMTGRPWTKPELFLFGRFTDEEIATATGRTIHSVRINATLYPEHLEGQSCLNGHLKK